MKGLLRSLCISSGYPQQKLGTFRGAPKSNLATEMSPTSSSDPCISTNICASTPPQKRQVPESCGDRLCHRHRPYTSHRQSWASIQLGQHHFVATRCNPWVFSRNFIPPPLQLCVAAVLLQLTLHWMGNTISTNLNHPSIHACCQITRPCFIEQHA